MDPTREQAYRDLGLWTDDRIGWLLRDATDRGPDSDFLVFGDDTYTYRQVSTWVDNAAADLVAAGLGVGHRLLLQLPNCLEALIYQLAAFRIGVVVAPVIAIYRAHELGHIVDDLRPDAVVVAAELGDRTPTAEFDEILTRRRMAGVARFCVGPPPPGWRETVRWRPDLGVAALTNALPDPLPAAECCLILYTSGTTALPKGVMLSSRALLSQARCFQQTLELDADDCVVCVAPLSHLAGFLNGFLLPAVAGARTLLLPRWDPDAAVADIERYRGTFCVSAPVFLADVVSRYEHGASPGYRLDLWCCGAAPPPPGLVERAEKVGIRAFRAYGMTESSGSCTLARRGDPLALRAGTDGRVVDGAQVQAVDEHRAPLPDGEQGELRVRGPQLLIGYTDAGHSAAQIDGDGWFYTGDVGVVDGEGWVQLRGRLKDIVNRGGEKFSTRDIEESIGAHPDVASVAVVGVPDERLGEVVGAFLVLAPGASWHGPGPVLEHLDRLALARPKRPVEWHVLDELPMTATGKVQKTKLLQMRSGVDRTPREEDEISR